jgi:predicted acyltransferase
MPELVRTVPRPEIPAADVDAVSDALQQALYQRLEKMNQGGYASKLEILGTLEQEVHQLKKALAEDHLGLKPVKNELMDMAVTCVLGIACIRAGIVKI